MIIKKKKNIQPKESVLNKQETKADSQEEFDFSNIKFEERTERRKGNRRRGYRRIDDRNLVSRAQQEAISIKDNAAQEGYQQGLAQAQQEIDKITEALSDFYSYKNKMLEEVSKDVLDIALEISQKIIKKESNADKTILLNLIVDIFNNNISKENKVTLRAGIGDADYLKQNTEQIVKLTQTEAKINVIEDPKIIDGGVIVETNNGIVDASFKTQFELLKEALKKI